MLECMKDWESDCVFLKKKEEIKTTENLININYNGNFKFHFGEPSSLSDYRYGLYLASHGNGKVSFNIDGKDYSLNIEPFILIKYYDTANDRYMGALNFEAGDDIMESLKKDILNKTKRELEIYNAKEYRKLFEKHNKPFAINIQFEAKESDIIRK